MPIKIKVKLSAACLEDKQVYKHLDNAIVSKTEWTELLLAGEDDVEALMVTHPEFIAEDDSGCPVFPPVEKE